MALWPPKELSLIRQGLSEFFVKKSPDHDSTEVINLHGNYLTIIPDLKTLRNLRELDLSSNRIDSMHGLENLCSLQTLNLSCNFIKNVECLSSLKSLLKINLSHNQIKDIGGFVEMAGQDYALTVINLCDNKIASQSHVVSCLRNCTNLRCLILSHDGLTNPVCEMLNYRVRLLSRLNQLLILDDISRDGQSVIIDDLQDLDLSASRFYLDLSADVDDTALNEKRNHNSRINKISHRPSIIPNDNGQPSIPEISTPRIDQIIEKYREQYPSDYSTDLKSENIGVSTSSDFERNSSTENHSEMMLLSLDSVSFASPKSNKLKSNLEEKDSSAATKHTKTGNSSSPVQKKNAAPKRNNKSCTKVSQHKIVSSQLPQINRSNESVGQSKEKTKGKKKTAVPDQTDQDYRNVIESTYNCLIEELNEEKSQRLKAELALKEMTSFVNDIQVKSHKAELHYENAFQENLFLKENLTKEKETVRKLQGDLLLVTQTNADIENQLKVSEKSLQSQKVLFANLQKSANGSERDHEKELADEQKKTKKYQLLAANAARESQELKSMVSFLQKRVKELEQLLTSRELEHKEDLKDRYKLDSKELRLVIDDKLEDVRRQHEERMKLQTEREEMMKKHYEEVTMELNCALQLESGQVTKLESAYNTVSKENELNKQALMAVQAKEKKAVETLSQLTNVVKKQKEQISDLLNSKQELISCHDQEMKKMERQLDDTKKNSNHFSKLKQDRLKLEAQIEAQESLIVGLRAERKMWENELAQQGTSLAQDRGRLEVKIETLTTEVEYLKKQLKSEVDTVKIKSKLIEDQTDSIKMLKMQLSQKDKEIHEIQEEAVRSKKKLEDEIALEQDALQESQFTIQRLHDRKEELKDQISQIETELRESKDAHNILKEHWKQKTDMISSLEIQVRQAKSSWEKKEEVLKAQWTKAQQEVKQSEEKLKKADDAFRKQIAEKEKSQQAIIVQLQKDHHLEMDLANQKILDLEEEMRAILKDSHHMQENMEKLADFFGNITTVTSK